MVVTDLQMPQLDGLGLLREIRRMDSAPPVVIQSATLDASMEFVLRRAGAFRALVKGVSLEELVETVAEACGLTRSSPACPVAPRIGRRRAEGRSCRCATAI